MKKIFVSVIAAALIVPQVAFASWWNPTTWNIWHIFEKSPKQVEIVDVSNQKSTTTVTVNAKLSQAKEAPTNDNKKSTISLPKKIITESVPSEPVQPATKQAEMRTVLCQSTTRTACPVGQSFVCESNGNYYCKDAPTQSIPANTTQTYIMPNGAVVDANGNIITPAPQIAQDNQLQDQLLQQQQAQQDKITRINQQIKTLQQQILDIKAQYYRESAGYGSTGTSVVAQGNIDMLMNEANRKINIINLQIQQLQLQY